MQLLTTSAPVTANNRLVLALFLAAVVHASVILGISFSSPEGRREVPPTLDVVLVQTQGPGVPEEADYLAQISQDGGGTSPERIRPKAPFTTIQPSPTRGVAPRRLKASTPPQAEVSPKPVVAQRVAESKVMVRTQPQFVETSKPRFAARAITRSLEVARLTAEISEDLEEHAKRPRKKFIHARTQEAVSAAYMEAWVRKVERLGNLNYPDQARRNQLSGSLVLAVGIKSDGSVHDMMLQKSSGHKILDDAAKRIVTLAAPFAPFSSELRKETDILYITRTWQFLSSNRLTSH